VAVAQKYQGDAPPVVGSIYKPGPAATESVIVSGIRMTPDCKYMIILRFINTSVLHTPNSSMAVTWVSPGMRP